MSDVSSCIASEVPTPIAVVLPDVTGHRPTAPPVHEPACAKSAVHLPGHATSVPITLQQNASNLSSVCVHTVVSTPETVPNDGPGPEGLSTPDLVTVSNSEAATFVLVSLPPHLTTNTPTGQYFATPPLTSAPQVHESPRL